MDWPAWVLIGMVNVVMIDFWLWWRGLDGRCRKHLRCIIRRRLT